MLNEKRCVITGLGLVCAIGDNVDECFDAALNGKSGIADAKSFDTTECYSHKGAEVRLSDEELAGGKYDRTTFMSSLSCVNAEDSSAVCVLFSVFCMCQESYL